MGHRHRTYEPPSSRVSIVFLQSECHAVQASLTSEPEKKKCHGFFLCVARSVASAKGQCIYSLDLPKVVFLCAPKRETNKQRSCERADWPPTKTDFEKVYYSQAIYSLCSHFLGGGSRIYREGVRITDRQRREYLGWSGGMFPRKILKF